MLGVAFLLMVRVSSSRRSKNGTGFLVIVLPAGVVEEEEEGATMAIGLKSGEGGASKSRGAMRGESSLPG